jgi:hypothetical protein
LSRTPSKLAMSLMRTCAAAGVGAKHDGQQQRQHGAG